MSPILTRLEHAREHLRKPGVWVNHFPIGHEDCMSTACHSLDQKMVSQVEAQSMPSYVGAIKALVAALPPRYAAQPGDRLEQPVWMFNDDPARTLEEVLAVFDRAIATVKASEESAQSASAPTQST